MTLAGMTQEQTNEHNRNHCKEISEQLDAVANGEMYRCEYCGNIHTEDELKDIDGYDDATCPTCQETRHFEQMSIFDYFEGDIYDIKYMTTSELEYYAARVMVACGGPNIYVDTFNEAVMLYWWGDQAEYPLKRSTVETIDEYMEMLFESSR